MGQAYLTSRTKLMRINPAVAVGTTSITAGTKVDSAGWEGVRFWVAFGSITDGTPTIKARQGQQANMSDGADLAGTLVTGAVTDDDKMLLVDVFRPQERYLDCVVGRGGATGAVIDGIFAELYGPRTQPAAKDTTVAVQEAHTSPAEGTA